MSNDSVKEATYQAEESLIGSLLLMSGSRKPIEEVVALLTPGDFLHFFTRDCFAAMINADGPPNQIIVAHELQRAGKLKAGDCASLAELVAKCPSPLDYLHYAKTVKEYSLQRGGKPTTRELNYY